MKHSVRLLVLGASIVALAACATAPVAAPEPIAPAAEPAAPPVAE
jgi:hypothetical protein